MRSIKKNSGKSIQSVADGVLGLGIIISVVIGIALLAFFANWESAGIGILTFIVVTGIGCAISWIISTFLHGFGEIVEYVAEGATYLEDIVDPTGKRMSASNSTTKVATSSVAIPDEGKVTVIPASSNMKRCDVCGTMNHYRNQVCVSCGHTFKQ